MFWMLEKFDKGCVVMLRRLVMNILKHYVGFSQSAVVRIFQEPSEEKPATRCRVLKAHSCMNAVKAILSGFCFFTALFMSLKSYVIWCLFLLLILSLGFTISMIVPNLPASGSQYEYAGDSWSFWQWWEVCILLTFYLLSHTFKGSP